MTYNINKELLEIANNKDAFKFNLKKYKADTLQELESYKSTDEAKSLANIAINTILLVGNNKGFETIEKQVKATINITKYDIFFIQYTYFLLCI